MTNKAERPKIVIALNTAWNLVNFRVGLIESLHRAGYEVVAVAPSDGCEARLPCRFLDLPMDNGGTNPLRDIVLMMRFMALFRRERPAVFLAYTVKPNIYGGLAAWFMRVPTINNVAGLGSVFIRNGILAKFVRQLYRIALTSSAKVFFQNPDDLALFQAQRVVAHGRVGFLPGSGVDLARFAPAELLPSGGDSVRPLDGKPIVFLLLARLLWDKGLAEYVAAATQLRAEYGDAVEFHLAGQGDIKNPSAVSQQQLDEWVSAGRVRYFGFTEDVRPLIANADVVVLPSFREGTPKTLLEAAAMGKPLIATDVPGCREVVMPGENGLLCEARSSDSLAAAMRAMLAMTSLQRQQMGLRGRSLVEAKFDERIVHARYIDAIAEILPAGTS